jgi:hypothetical protein
MNYRPGVAVCFPFLRRLLHFLCEQNIIMVLLTKKCVQARALRTALFCLRSLKAGGDSEHFSSPGMNMTLQVIPCALEILFYSV